MSPLESRSIDSRPPVKRYEHGSRVPGWDEAVDLTKAPAVVPDPAQTPVPEALRAAIEHAMAQYPDPRSASIPALHLAQRHHGWCSPEAIAQVACVMRLTPAYLTSVASFYDMFVLAPKPEHDIFVCTNITCSLLGADELYERMCVAAEGHPDIGVRGFECLGACDIGPMASVDGEYVGPLNLDDAELIMQDIEAGTDWVLKKPWADRRRVFAAGGSYGGFMVAYMNGHTGRYRAYVCHAGCYDWVSMMATDGYKFFAKELGAFHWDDEARVMRQSPHHYVGRARTPTLVVHGELDYRVPATQALQYYDSLKAKGVPARLVYFPDENHWILKPQNSRLWYREFFDWLARYVRATPAARRRGR